MLPWVLRIQWIVIFVILNGTIQLCYSTSHSVTSSMNTSSTVFSNVSVVNSSERKYLSSGRLSWPSLNQYKNKGAYVGEVIKDVLSLNAYLFSPTSFQILAMTFPAFVVSRTFDCTLQKWFYCREHHKNSNQLSTHCEMVAKYSISIPIVGLGSLAFLASNDDIRMTSYVYLLGIPFVIFGKEVLKKLKLEECKRPWNEYFCKKEQSYGGFPSGHMAQATYTALLYGLRFGKYFALPLSAIALYVGGSFLSCNRHYFSQLIAGGALGAMYALAANTLIEHKLHEAGVTVRFGLEQNCPRVQLSYVF